MPRFGLDLRVSYLGSLRVSRQVRGKLPLCNKRFLSPPCRNRGNRGGRLSAGTEMMCETKMSVTAEETREARTVSHTGCPVLPSPACAGLAGWVSGARDPLAAASLGCLSLPPLGKQTRETTVEELIRTTGRVCGGRDMRRWLKASLDRVPSPLTETAGAARA